MSTTKSEVCRRIRGDGRNGPVLVYMYEYARHVRAGIDQSFETTGRSGNTGVVFVMKETAAILGSGACSMHILRAAAHMGQGVCSEQGGRCTGCEEGDCDGRARWRRRRGTCGGGSCPRMRGWWCGLPPYPSSDSTSDSTLYSLRRVLRDGSHATLIRRTAQPRVP